MLCGLAEHPTQAQPNATDILKKSYAAEGRVTFTGRMRTTLHMGSNRTSADVTVHRSGDRMRMEYLSGPSAGATILDDGKSVTRLDQRTRTAYVSGTPDAPDHLSLLLSNYGPIVTGEGRVAGRDCYVLAIRPKYAGNPSKRLCVDKSTFLALKTERFDSDGKLSLSTEYTSIDYSKRPAASLFGVPNGWKTMRLSGSGDSSLDAVRQSVGFMPVKPGYMPKGYTFDGYYVRENPRNVRFAVLRYTNGMNTLSLYQRRCAGQGRGQGRGAGRGMGRGRGQMAGQNFPSAILAETPHAQMAQVFVGDLTVIVVGDMASRELERIAQSFK